MILVKRIRREDIKRVVKQLIIDGEFERVFNLCE